MPNFHYVTMSGADNRADILDDTFKVVQPHFDKIHLLDLGSTDNTMDVGAKYSANIVRHEQGLDNWDWAKAVQLAYDMVPENDWFMFMDSDERPSQWMLDAMRENARYMHKKGRLVGTYFSLYHHDGARLPTLQMDADDYIRNFSKRPPMIDGFPSGIFTKSRLMFKCKDVSIRNNGPHFGFWEKDSKHVWFPHFYTHSKNDSNMIRGCVLAAYPVLRYHGGVADGPEETALIALAEKHNIPTANEMYARAKAGTLPEEFLKLWETWKDHKNDICRFYNLFAFKYNFDVLTIPKCGEACCLYNNGVQL